VQERARGPPSPCQVWWGLDFTGRWGSQKCWFFCLSVCLSRFWTSEIVQQISPWRRWSTETILIPLDRGRFVVVHPCSTFSDCCQLATPLNAEVQKTGKNWGFSPPQDDRLNRSIRNFAGKCIPWVCYSTPNLALINNRGSVQELQKMSKFPQNCGFWPPEANTMNIFIWNLACKLGRARADLGSAPAHQIWPSSVKGGRYRSPPNINKHKSSVVAEMGDRGPNRHGSKRGACCAPFAERWEAVWYNVACAEVSK